MARASNKISILFKFALLFSLLLMIMIITTAESRAIFGAKMEASSKLACESVVGVGSGDTCFGIAQSNHLTATAFSAINPNLNCTALFVGQWLCVDVSSN